MPAVQDRGPSRRTRLHLKGVEDGKTDIFIGLAMMDQIFPQLEVTPFGHQHAHLAVPESDMLASAEILALKDLAGRAPVLSPGRQDSEIIHRLSAIIEETGVGIVSAPESDRRSVEHFAHILRAPHLMCYTILETLVPLG